MADRNNGNRISKDQPQDASRRNFMKYTGTALGGAVVGGLIGGVIGNSMKGKGTAETPAPTETEKPTKNFNEALMFLTQDQFQVTEAAAERIFPTDDLGPGAKALGVAFFIDHQLAGAWGINARDYMMAPFYEADAEQGYQLGFKRNELFALGLTKINEYSQTKFSKRFIELIAEEQDTVLTAFEKSDKSLKGVPAGTFFNLLRQLTIEGVYADPLYSGNRNMDGWRMRSYPGNQMSYYETIDKDEFQKIEPLSLHDHLNLG
ncbi:gluconate 2-dehydrogenase subunit 3 family protein [Paenibacillus sp. NEAU-GSW1]|uniref:gluconate 2-dehydrogenase subunit 3 family protein n=1 Tax=Paenibacillus sp. NEAU-GSW1 TaxID=2682486 RepID=UPI0012E2E35F|nr:gluconate 2-dehydrogenase subunit 3 family protein [Paenibacillus sp. NEAU-GSW1]MUT67797.1 twin-arginine translocation signal domain-containing protein [Paenibacillus sp. NEAU-GSW1]